MNKTFVIAGNQYEAEYWIKQNLEKRYNAGETSLSKSHYVYVADTVYLRGVRDPHGVFIGSWRDRVDILEILELLLISCTQVNVDLVRLRDEVRLKSKKPTPKLKPVAGGWINEDLVIKQAAMLMSKQIDEEVLNEIMGATWKPV